MSRKTMKEEVEAIDRKILSYCEKIEAALEPVAEIKIGAPDQSPYVVGVDGMDMARFVHRQVVRARDFAWVVQRLPYLDLSFLTTMKKVTFTVKPRHEPSREITLAMPSWGVTTYPSWSGNRIWHDPKSRKNEAIQLVMPAAIPEEVALANETALGNEWLRPQADIAEVPAALRRRIDPFLARFDQVVVIGEADWHAVPGADPLVVGIIDNGPKRHAFLLGEYDPTKLEKYIVAELAVKPKE